MEKRLLLMPNLHISQVRWSGSLAQSRSSETQVASAKIHSRCLLLACLDRLEHAKPALLHRSHSVLLLLLQLLVSLLQLLELGLEGGLGILHFLLTLGDLRIEVSSREGHSVLDRLLLLGIAQVEVGRSTGRSEVLLGEGQEIIVRAAALVVLHVVGVTVLDGRV